MEIYFHVQYSERTKYHKKTLRALFISFSLFISSSIQSVLNIKKDFIMSIYMVLCVSSRCSQQSSPRLAELCSWNSVLMEDLMARDSGQLTQANGWNDFIPILNWFCTPMKFMLTYVSGSIVYCGESGKSFIA